MGTELLMLSPAVILAAVAIMVGARGALLPRPVAVRVRSGAARRR